MKQSIVPIIVNTIFLLSVQTTNCMDPSDKENGMQLALFNPAWRESYKKQIATKSPEDTLCPFCTIPSREKDIKKEIIYQGTSWYVRRNTSPYTNNGIHVLIIPKQHIKDFDKLSSDDYKELIDLTQWLSYKLHPYNREIKINNNLGRSAGATVPDHLHQHIITENQKRCYNLKKAIKYSTSPANEIANFEFLEKLFSVSINTMPLTISLPSIPASHSDNCYYCKILLKIKNCSPKTSNNDYKKLIAKNLIFFKNEYLSILFDHHPYVMGSLIIIPNHHYSNIQELPSEILHMIYTYAQKTLPIILSLFNFTDANISMICKGALDDTNNPHLSMKIIPRSIYPSISPGLQEHYIFKDMNTLYQSMFDIFKNKDDNILSSL